MSTDDTLLCWVRFLRGRRKDGDTVCIQWFVREWLSGEMGSMEQKGRKRRNSARMPPQVKSWWLTLA